MAFDPKVKDHIAGGKNFAALTTLLPSGQPMTHIMWVDADDTHVLVNTEVHRTKFKNLERDPRVTVTVWDGANPYTYVEIRGRVSGTTAGPEARAHIDALAKRYMDADTYPGEIESERVIVRIEPETVKAFNL